MAKRFVLRIIHTPPFILPSPLGTYHPFFDSKSAPGRNSGFYLGHPSSTLPPNIVLASSSLPPRIGYISFPYSFRIVSASGSENDRRTIGGWYGIDTGSIRDRYETDTRPTLSDRQLGRLIKSLSFSSIITRIIFYILTFYSAPLLIQRWLRPQ